jgi:DNA-binding Lrp family transcriptional regulator
MSDRPKRRKLTRTDREILKALLQRNGHLSTTELSARIGVPRSTVERRRRYLEQNVIRSEYQFDITKYGFRRVNFLIESGSGFNDKISKRLMQIPEVISVSQTIGEHTIDLIAELIVKDNGQILVLTEQVKAMQGVKDVIWTEVIKEERKKTTVPDFIIDEL